MMRTDANNNPTAFTTEIARQAGLKINVDYVQGAPFPISPLFTAKLLDDPVAITIRVIDAIGFTTKTGTPRWVYINLPDFVWEWLTYNEKRDIIGYMYQHEGGLAMKSLFPNYGKK